MDSQINVDNINELFLTSKSGEIYIRAVEHLEKRLIEKALEESLGNQVLAAKILGLNRNTLHSKVKKLDIDISKFK